MDKIKGVNMSINVVKQLEADNWLLWILDWIVDLQLLTCALKEYHFISLGNPVQQ